MSGGRGSAVIEFALILPLVLVVLLGAVEVAVIAHTDIQVSQAARGGVVLHTAQELAIGFQLFAHPVLVIRRQNHLLPELGTLAQVFDHPHHLIEFNLQVLMQLDDT